MASISNLPSEILYIIIDLLEDIADFKSLRDSHARRFGLPLNESIRRRFSFSDRYVVDALFWGAATHDEKIVRYILENSSSPFAIWLGREEREERRGGGVKEEGEGEEVADRGREDDEEEVTSYFVLGMKPTNSIIHQILGQGANLLIADHFDSSSAVKKGQLLHEYSALSWWIKKGSLLKIKWLLEMGADPGLLNSYEHTAFDAVAQRTSVDGDMVLRLFHKREADNYFWIGYGGCSVEHLDDLSYKGRDGNTLVHLATICSRPVDMVMMVLAAGVDVNAKNQSGKTALELAFDYEQTPPELIRLLLERGAEITMSSICVIDSDGWTPEIHAKIAVWLEYMEPTYRGDGKESLLHLAIRCKMPVKYIENLLGRGVDINGQDCCSRTALHLATGYGNEERYELLRKKGADMAIRDDDGYTPPDRQEEHSLADVGDLDSELAVGIDEESMAIYLGVATDGW